MRGNILRHILLILGLSFIGLGGTSQLSAQVSAEVGETLFKQKCTACHAMDRQLVGPALQGVAEKYAGDEEWLYKWIRNAPGLIASGDEKAVALYNQYNQQAMNAFTTLTDDQIASLLVYFSEWQPEVVVVDGQGSGTVSGDALQDPNIYYALLGLVGVLVLIALLLVIITATLVTAVRAKDQQETFTFGDVFQRTREILRNKFFVATVTPLIILIAVAVSIKEARTIGLHQGYMPEQPIKFSHQLHAGQYEIDCKYCHTGVTKSKNAWIPSVNICMNCHKYIQEGPQYGAEEIAKIYEAYGWDPTQMAKTGEGKPVQWVRIHNTPDHAYFNHAQHVVAGQLECQTCHGPIEEMEVVYQYSDLGMGWCINCHRNEQVKTVEGNTTRVGYTVEDMGGLNCARCHY